MQAIFLYNSREYAAIDFFARLRPLLEDADWLLMADFVHGLEGTTGDSYARLCELLREVDVVIYAVGPFGEGNVQGNFEAGQLIQARNEVHRQGRELKIVPVLVGGATADQLHAGLRHLTAQMDNAHQGGMGLLGAVYKAVTDRELPDPARALNLPRLSSIGKVQEACLAMTGRARRHGLTLFIGPYAASDAHSAPTPHFYAAEHLKFSAQKAEFAFASAPGDLITHPWLAATASQALRPAGYVWPDLRSVIHKHLKGNDPLPLHGRIAALARSWTAANAGASAGNATWNGLLIVATDQCRRLERALFEATIPFGRLRYTIEGDFVYEEPTFGRDGPNFKTEQVFRVSETARSAAPEAPPFDPKPVLLLKVLGCEAFDEAPALTTDQLLRSVWERIPLPDTLSRHMEKAAFLMLGGGFFNPIVSYVFATLFLPYFEGWHGKGAHGSRKEAYRYVAFQPSPGRGDPIRNLERDMDRGSPDWLERLSELKRIDWPLTDFILRLAYELEAARGGAS